MIESLRHTHSRSLTLFAIWASAVGAAVDAMSPLIWGMQVNAATGNSGAVMGLLADLHASAVQTSLYMALMSLILLCFSFLTLASALIKTSHGADDGIVRLVAKSIYLLSLLSVVGNVSATVFLAMLRA